jgi:hypothetical protein
VFAICGCGGVGGCGNVCGFCLAWPARSRPGVAGATGPEMMVKAFENSEIEDRVASSAVFEGGFWAATRALVTIMRVTVPHLPSIGDSRE